MVYIATLNLLVFIKSQLVNNVYIKLVTIVIFHLFSRIHNLMINKILPANIFYFVKRPILLSANLFSGIHFTLKLTNPENVDIIIIWNPQLE